MRAKNISFAQVLRSKTHRSPQLELKNNLQQLADLLQQWEQYPDCDYTLYLGPTQTHNKSQYSASKIFGSRNQKQEAMFDSWIQKQSMISQKPINDNTQGFRSKKFESSKVSQGSTKNNYNSRPQEANKPPKTIGELVRRNKETLHVQNSSQFANLGGNIQMIKSKTMQNEKKHQAAKPVNFRRQPEIHQIHQIQLEEPPKQVKFQENKAKFSTNKSRQSIQPPKFGVNFKNVIQSRRKEQSIEELVENTSNITYQIAQLAKKYLDQDQPQPNEIQIEFQNQQQEDQEQQLLIQDSANKPVVDEEPRFSEGYAQIARKADEIDRLRKQEAKNKINDLMKNYKIGRKNEQIFAQPERRVYEEQNKVQDNYQVGYSFASNQPCQQSRKGYSMNEIAEIENRQLEEQSDKPLKIQSSQEFQFKKRYVNYQQSYPCEYQINCDINSSKNDIKTSIREQEGIINQNQPNSSFEKKLITSENEHSSVDFVELPKGNANWPELPRKDSIEQFSKIEVVSKQVKNSSQASLFKVEFQSIPNKSFTQQFAKPSHQKIKIVSSGKNYIGLSNKSQKSGSAKSSNEKNSISQLPKDIKTQPFVPIIEKTTQNERAKDFLGVKQVNRSNERCSPFKTIKQVKNSIINPSKSPQVSQPRIISTFEANTHKSQPLVKQQTTESLSKLKLSQFEPKKEEIGSSYTNNYIQPTYGSKNSISLQNKYNYATSDYTKQVSFKTTPTNFASPVNNQTNSQPSYAVKGIKSSKEIVNENYLNASYGQKQFASPKTYAYQPKYEPKFATTINSSYQACEKFNSILSLTTKEFPEVETQTTVMPKEVVSNPVTEISGKRTVLTELDIKQSINFQDFSKKAMPLNIQKPTIQTKIELPTKLSSSGLDNALKKSLKQSINVQNSGQFNFDF